MFLELLSNVLKRFCFCLILMSSATAMSLAEDVVLSGTVLNEAGMAFDRNASTYFAATEPDYGWAGLDLGERHVITKIGWMPRNNDTDLMLLGVFEGANSPDFMDALPLLIIKSASQVGVPGEMTYADVTCSQGFQYVRYVGPAGSYANVAELEFYGYEGLGDHSNITRISNLPTLSIHTVDGAVPYDKEHEIPAQFTIIGDNANDLLSEPGSIRERGNASRDYPKRPWRIKFEKKQHVLDAPAKAKKWTLINNWGDKTLMRNLLAFELSRRLGMPYTPYGRPVDVLFNGEYKGCYQLCDQVQVHKKRVNIEEMTPRDNSGDALTGGYFFEIDAYAERDETSYFFSNKGKPVTIKSPDEDSITSAQKNYIQNHFNKMESNWSKYLDLNTFLRHFLVGEFAGNIDTYWCVFMYKQRMNDTIYTGPVWDFDLAFNNDKRITPPNEMTDFVYRSGGSCVADMLTFVDNVIVNTASTQDSLRKVWEEARYKGLDEENLVAFIDSLEDEIMQSQELNFIRWPIMNERVHMNPIVWGSYEAEVGNVRDYVVDRISWMDNRLGAVIDPALFVDQPFVNNGNNAYEDDLVMHFNLKSESLYESNAHVYYSINADQLAWNGRNDYASIPVGGELTGELDLAQSFADIKNDLTPNQSYTVYFYTDKNRNKPYNYPSATFTYRSKLTVDYSVESMGYGTLILPFDHELPEGWKVYGCSGVDENGVLTLDEDVSIRRNVPYIIQATPGTTYQFVGPKAIDADKPTFTEGVLVGVVADNVPLVAGTDYIMQDQAGRVAFYKYTGTPSTDPLENDSNNNRLATPFRAYLRLNNSANAKLFLPNHIAGETEGIEEIGNENARRAGFYSIDGKRHESLQKGFNLIISEDGSVQKVFVK